MPPALLRKAGGAPPSTFYARYAKRLKKPSAFWFHGTVCVVPPPTFLTSSWWAWYQV